MKQFVYVFLIATITGCTTVGQVNKNYGQINVHDGIDAKEAVFIAQKQCLNDEECKGRVRISMPEIRYDSDAGRWNVTFASKDLNNLDYTFLVNIDPKTGEAALADVEHNF